MSKVAVIGGCGRLGFKLSLVLACKGHTVSIIDIDEEKINEIKGGCLPFVEKGAEIYLEEALKKKTLTLNLEHDIVSKAEIIIITIGTPVDSNLNPSLEPVAGIIFDLSNYLKKGQLIIFRNTLSPQIVDRIKTLIEDKTGLTVGQDIYLAFAPEIANENANINDILKSPQPIGTYDNESFKLAEKFFKTITKGKITQLNPEEVLLAKLMKNMYTYIQNACANEFYLIAEAYKANIHKILESINNKENNIPLPNANASGPGPHKEGWFLVDKIPFAELVTTAFKINESLPNYLVQKLENYKVNKVAILGMTNKPNSDDVRSSLSYKLRKALYYKDYNVACYDPYLPEYSDSSVLLHSDVVILMTPHDEFKDLEKINKLINNPKCVYLDVNGFWKGLKTKSHHAK
ncbi:MAG: nucleotide sugar dehydrogenase [Candidatus Melainabacteria bacterium]|nr:nucleotide sugar dehydrogenase [Candidatus Melainabacteria bacterium]